AVARRVDLDVADALVDERLNLRLDDRHDVPKEVRVSRIGLFADPLLVGDRRELVRRRQRHLDVAGRVRSKELDFVPGESPRLANPGDDGASGRADTAGDGDAGTRALPGAIDFVLAIEAVDRLVEVAHEPGAAQFAVGEDLEAGILLPFQDFEDATIINCPELRLRPRAVAG